MVNMAQGYEYFENQDDNKTYAIEVATGEVYETIMTEQPVGTISYTPEDQRIAKERKEQQRKFFERREYEKRLGGYIFVNINEDFDDVSPETLARLVYLSSYLRYESDTVFKTQRTELKFKDLPEFMQLSEATTRRFWKDVSPKYAYADEYGVIHVNNTVFRFGKIGKNDDCMAYQKIYKSTVQELYLKTPVSMHRRLGFIFRMLPYINIEYNVLCENIFETAIERVHLLSIKAFCDIIRYDYSTVARLIKEYETLHINVNDCDEPVFEFIKEGRQRIIFLNPHLVYSGKDYEKAEAVKRFCRDELAVSR